MKRFGSLFAAIAASLVFPGLVSAAQPGACDWTVTPNAGVDIAIAGTGFAPNATVTISWDRNVGPLTNDTVTTDATGAFIYSIGAGPGNGGSYRIDATDGSCSVETTVVAVETAGGGGTAPPTHTDASPPAAPERARLTAVAGLAMIGAIVGVLVLRLGRRRQG